MYVKNSPTNPRFNNPINDIITNINPINVFSASSEI